MSSKALTDEEWTKTQVEIDCGYHTILVALYGRGTERFMDIESDSADRDVRPGYADLNKIAALCLHQQEFGFTQEDVKMLRGHLTEPRSLDDLANRIEALLPPESNDAK